MSILVKPYEISVWKDVWNSEKGKFIEERIGIIGTNTMESQCQAIDPKLDRNINGTKKLTFQMYKYYKDTITGEKIKNPFIDWLTSEQKVKLKYGTYIDETGKTKDIWYDFIIKNIDENSSNYLNTFQLEDALVQELSKNGFSVVLDSEKENNLGTAKELASEALKETDWQIESEVFVQTVEEGLVYVRTPENFQCYHVNDQTDLTQGISVSNEVVIFKERQTVLAFYSCCKNKPHRFQFIYLPNGYNTDSVDVDNRGFIDMDNCQYYIDIDKPQEKYLQSGDFYLPNGCQIESAPTATNAEGLMDTTISNFYRAKKYGFSHMAKYIPLLDKYCNLYKKNNVDYYGYIENQYTPPALVQNIITNTEFKNTSGWVGSYEGKTPNHKKECGVKVESVYGYFTTNGSNTFVSVIDDLASGEYNDSKAYQAYLKTIFPNKTQLDTPILLNTGFYDNRIVIGNISKGEQWCLEYEILNENGAKINNGFNFELREVSYNPIKGCYDLGDTWGTYKNGIITFTHEEISKKDFRSKEIKLIISCETAGTYYIKNLSLYRRIINDKNEVVLPGSIEMDGVIEKKYHFFTPEQLTKVSSEDEIIYETIESIDYSIYVPVYNIGAEKIRLITAKESNYFNILQSIAETFGCWVDIQICRDDNGAIEKKTIFFKNYIGKDNFVGFKYGINLSGIQRIYESKNIVTKLIVKQNSNEHANDGFCTIARAEANPTGENYIYDFSYFNKTGLLIARDYFACVYYSTNPFDGTKEVGPDIGNGDKYNLQNYFNRIKYINIQLIDINDKYIGLQQELLKYSADLKVQEGIRDASLSSLEQVEADFLELTGSSPVKLDGTIDYKNSSVINLLTEYATYMSEHKHALEAIGDEQNPGLAYKVNKKEQEIEDLLIKQEGIKSHKIALNRLFFEKYSRFIQEGTWISEEYTDDNKYYIDAQAVMSHSCFPKVSYSINVLSISGISGYEDFDFNIGDKTYVEDYDFFGKEGREEVVITETSETLNDPSKNTIKVQNFKDQFQDLFQKITATTQQIQYKEGSYDKAAALAEANNEIKGKFVSDGLDTYGQKLEVAGQTSVVQDENGITLTDSATKDQMRLIGGAILMSVEDKETGQRIWKTGLTPEGISASLMTTGILNAGNIQIMNINEPVFRWDAFGISAFDADWTNGVINRINPYKFVRYDKFGIYGINSDSNLSNESVNGIVWKPNSQEEIDNNATFALTWDGLKVTGDGGYGWIGKHVYGKEGDNDLTAIIRVNDGKRDTFLVDAKGNVTVRGNLIIDGGEGNSYMSAEQSGDYSWKFDTSSGIYMYQGGISNGTKLFSIDGSGLYMKGTISADKGGIGGWQIDTTYIRDKGSNVYLYSENQNLGKTIGGHSTNAWRITVGNSFGITYDGKIYATAGKIGSMTITEINNGVGNAQTALETADEAKEIAQNATNTSGSYSWKFDPNLGLFMYKGDSSDPDLPAIFSITNSGLSMKIKEGNAEKELFSIKNGALSMDGSGTFTGKIIANSGQIGSIYLEDFKNIEGTRSGDGLSYKINNEKMFSLGYGQLVWEKGMFLKTSADNDWWAHAIFCISPNEFVNKNT